MITGIICEYNPLHKGHQKQLDLVRQADPDGGIVCLMSGNFVQRGKPAIFNKVARAKAAIDCGADLVLELPINYALSSAEGFAAGGVRILGQFCQKLCFGAETADDGKLMALAQGLLDPRFPEQLRLQLEKGLSFPAARQAALTSMGLDAFLLSSPNNILAVEYCKAIISQNSKMQPFPILRQGDYHALEADFENPSATSVRNLITGAHDWKSYIPQAAIAALEGETIHDIAFGEKAILTKLRTMTDEEFEALPFGAEGLWRKLMRESRRQATLEQILTAVKSKRYTRTRLDRMVMCAFLGITERMLEQEAPYVRVLALNEKGRQILNQARKFGEFVNVGQTMQLPWQSVENRAGSLYGLFSQTPEPPNSEEKYRVYCK